MSLNIPDNMRFLINCSIDPDGFRKMQCPRCTMTFKIEVAPGEYSDPLALHLSRVLEEDDDDDSTPHADLSCPYCGHGASKQKFIDDEMERTIHLVAKTQIIAPMLDAFMSNVTNSFKQINSSFMKVTVTETHTPRALLPFSGPEVADMRRATLLCCGRPIKLAEQWVDHFFCPHCRTDLIIT